MDLLDFSITGGAISSDDLDRYKNIDRDYIPDDEVPEHPVIRNGDVWILGAHRVVCGDSTNSETVRCALNGAQPILMVTDPPYGVEYNPGWREDYDMFKRHSIGKVENDTRSDWSSAWKLFSGNIAYIWHADKYSNIVQRSIESAGFEVRSQIIWAKPHFVFSRGNYHWQHEPCWYAIRSGCSANWNGGHKQTTIWQIKNSNPMGGKREELTGHGTQKPIECMQRPIENNTVPGDYVYEPFLGSGTTLMAAEFTGRLCCAIELNPLYVYISIRRWQHHSGVQAILEATGETFTEVLLRRKNEPEIEPPSKTINKVTPITIVFAPPIKPVELPATGSQSLPLKGVISAPVSLFEPTQPSKLTSALTTVPIIAQSASITLSPRRSKKETMIKVINAVPQQHSDPFLVHHARRLTAAGRGRLFFDANEWDHSAKTAVGLDVEVFPNFFLVCFKRFSDGHRLAFEMSNRCPFDVEGVRSILESNVTISFNGLNYDLPMIRAALGGADTTSLWELSQEIIKRNERQPWGGERWDHVDLFEVNPSVKMGLKVLHGRLHGRWMVDLPFPPEEPLTPEQMNIVTLYCMNDLDATEGLREALLGPLMMRDELGRRHGLDLLSKSDAQVGEAIVRARLGGRVGRPDPQFRSFCYTPPGFLKFRGEGLREILAKIARETFTVDPGGKVVASDWMKDLKVTIGAETYSMGIGGLHSTEAHRAVFSDDKLLLLDVDASSQYPNIIIGLGAVGLHPSAAGPKFTRVYAEMVKERLEAKAAGDKVKADGLKIATNGCFGKLASPHSFLYAPDLFLATTLTGQLSLLMLTEMVEGVGATVVSANTDGLVIHCPRNCVTALDETLAGWEAAVGMTLERTAYSALYSSSVNTYLAVKEDGGTKRKGWIANPWAEGDFRGMMQKNPQMTVLSDAVVGRLTQGVPLETTINAAFDPRAFVTVIQARGGASWRCARLGRVVRYYWSTDGEPIVYTDSGRRVAKTEGARPMMELTDRLPADLDRERYITEAAELLNDLGSGTNLI